MGLISFLSAWTGPAKAGGRRFGSVTAFRQYIMTILRERHSAQSVVADRAHPARFRMVVNGKASTVDVTNAYGYITSYPQENSDELIDRFIRSLTESHDAPIEDGQIVAVIRTRDYVDAMGPEVLHEPLGADLVILYMADRPDSMAPLSKSDLAGKDLASIRKIALDNVRTWLPKVVADDRIGDELLYSVEGNTMLSTSLILLDDFWMSIAARFPGDVLIALPRRGQLFIFDDGKPAVRVGPRRLIDATTAENFNLLSPTLYARRGGKIVAVSD